MSNKILGWGILITLAITIFQEMFKVRLSEFDIFLLGYTIIFFGIWGGIRLIISEKKEGK